MQHRKIDHAGRWQAIAYTLAAVLALTNAVWFYNWRARAVEHHTELTLARSAQPEPVIVREYVERPEPTTRARTTTLADDERCIGGQVLRKIPNGWAGTGRNCHL